MNHQELDLRADQIESVLIDHRTPGRVTGGNVTPRWVQFLLQPAPGVRSARIAQLSSEIAQALGASRANITAHNGIVRIDVPRSDPQPLKLSKMIDRLPVDRLPACTAVLGLADDGGPLLVRFPSPEVKHVTCPFAVARTIFESLQAMNHAKAVQLMTIGLDLPHAQAVGPAQLKEIVQRRMRENFNNPRIVVGIDLLHIDGADLDVPMLYGFECGVHVVGVSPEPKNDRGWGVVITRDEAGGDYIAHAVEGEIRFTLAEV